MKYRFKCPECGREFKGELSNFAVRLLPFCKCGTEVDERDIVPGWRRAKAVGRALKFASFLPIRVPVFTGKKSLKGGLALARLQVSAVKLPFKVAWWACPLRLVVNWKRNRADGKAERRTDAHRQVAQVSQVILDKLNSHDRAIADLAEKSEVADAPRRSIKELVEEAIPHRSMHGVKRDGIPHRSLGKKSVKTAGTASKLWNTAPLEVADTKDPDVAEDLIGKPCVFRACDEIYEGIIAAWSPKKDGPSWLCYSEDLGSNADYRGHSGLERAKTAVFGAATKDKKGHYWCRPGDPTSANERVALV